MVKKKGKSKRTSLKDKYKIQRRIVETHRKRKKQAKRDAANGVVRHDKKRKDPGIPNSWPFKQDLLKGIKRARERQEQLQREAKEQRKSDLSALREHQKRGGTARTVQELMDRAGRDRAAFDGASATAASEETSAASSSTVSPGQRSRRAYLRELKKVVDRADVLLQVLDARDPVGSRIHHSVEDAILSRSDKRMVLVLNKIDLVPRDAVAGWLAALRRSHPTIAVRAAGQDRTAAGGGGAEVSDTMSTSTAPPSAAGTDGLLQLLKNYARTGESGDKRSKTTIAVGVIGYPNVGKSSVINALKRSRAVGVSPRPGFTTCSQEVVLDKTVRLLDCPGVVFDDRSAPLGNCIDAESIEDPIPPVEALLKRCNRESLLMAYSIPAFPQGDAMAFLALVARSRGRVLKGGIPDKEGAARAVLRDWNHGRIPYFTAPPAPASCNDRDTPVIVSRFREEFDLSKFDERVLGDTEDGDADEMDFVKLEGGGVSSDQGAIRRKQINFLTGDGSSDEDENERDDVQEMDEDTDDLAGGDRGK